MTASSPREHNARSLCIDKGLTDGQILDRKIHKPLEASGGILRVGKSAARFLGKCDRPVEGNAVCLPLVLTSRFTRTLTREGRGRITISFLRCWKKENDKKRKSRKAEGVPNPTANPDLVTAFRELYRAKRHPSLPTTQLPSFDLSISSSSLPVNSKSWRTDTHSP